MLLPKPLKKIVAVFRGGLSPRIITLSVALGFSFGFIPGFSGIHILIVILFALMNIHPGLFLFFACLGKSLCFAAAPLMYYSGIFVQDCLPVLPAFLGRIPILGLTDYTRYSVAGGVVFGPVTGVLAGLLMARFVTGFRGMWVKLEEGSEAYRTWTSKRWVIILDRLLIGKRTKDVRAALETQKPLVRKAGVVFAVLVLAGAFVFSAVVKDGRLDNYAETRLSQANGAEVNIGSLDLSMFSGKVGASGVEITDSKKPENNAVSFDSLEGNIKLYSLMCGKVVLDEVKINNVKFNSKRSIPGRLIESAEEEEKAVFKPQEIDIDKADISRLDKYFKNARSLKEKLEKVKKWLPSKESRAVEQKKVTPESTLEYLAARGQKAPAAGIIAKNILVENVELQNSQFGTCNITMQNISDAPLSYGKPVRIDVQSTGADRSMSMEIDFDDKNGGLVSGTFSNFDLGLMQSQMSSSNSITLEKGTASGEFEGTVSKEAVDIAVKVRIESLGAQSGGKGLFGLDERSASEVLALIDDLDMTMRIIGPVSEPRIAFDSSGFGKQFQDKLVEAGKKKLEAGIKNEIKEKMGDKLPAEIKQVIDKPEEVIKGLGDLFGGRKDKK